MELGQRLRQARLEAGLSQRQLCGDTITRNMLSQIENGSAKPSMETLRYLAGKLGKPMGYFLEEQAVTSPNQQVMAQARARSGQAALDALAQYQAPDPTFDAERYYLEALACMELARQVLVQQKPVYAQTLLAQAAKAGSNTPYYTPDTERRRLLLCYEAGMDAPTLASSLPDHTQELLLRARAALDEGRFARCAAILEAAEIRDGLWHFLRGEAHLGLKEYAPATEQYLQAENYAPKQVYARLEQCYRELEDYKQAYYYACRQR